MAVRIVTDSSCDLTRDEAAALDVEVVPLSIRFGDEEFTDGVVSFMVHNGAGYPIRAVARLQGAKLEFPQHPDSTIPLTLDNGATRLQIDVRTLTSGDSPLDVTLTTADGRIELGRTRVTIRSTAFSGVGLFLSLGAGLFLIIWWARHTAETRRASRQRLRHAVGAGDHPSQQTNAE